MDSNTHSNQPPQPLEQLEPPPYGKRPAHLESPEWLEGPEPPEPEQSEWPELPEDLAELAGLAAVADQHAAPDLEGLSVAVCAQRLLAWRHQLDRQEGLWLQELAALDADGAAATDPHTPAPSTASWLRRRLRMGAGPAHQAVHTARALFRGPLTGTAHALTDEAISPAHARVLANGTRQLPVQVAADAEPVLLEAARRLDPPLVRQAVG